MKPRYRALLAAIPLVVLVTSAHAQQSSTVTQADVQRLQDSVYLADRDISQLRSRYATRATQLSAELDDLRDEAVYLKVKLRKERALSRAEYSDVRDRIEEVKSRASGDVASTTPIAPATPSASTSSSSAPRASTPPVPPPDQTARSTASSAGALQVPVGTEIDVRLRNSLNSGTAQVEDRFEGTAVTDLGVDGQVAIPSGW